MYLGDAWGWSVNGPEQATARSYPTIGMIARKVTVYGDIWVQPVPTSLAEWTTPKL